MGAEILASRRIGAPKSRTGCKTCKCVAPVPSASLCFPANSRTELGGSSAARKSQHVIVVPVRDEHANMRVMKHLPNVQQLHHHWSLATRCRCRQIQADASVAHSSIIFAMPQDTLMAVWLSIFGQASSRNSAAQNLLFGTP